MVEVTVDVQMVLKVDHDGPTEGLKKAKYDALLEGLRLNPELAGDISRVLNKYICLSHTENTVGWIDDNVRYGVSDILDLTLIKIVEVKT